MAQFEAGETVAPESFDNATVLYSDIVGFTSLSAELSPIDASLSVYDDALSLILSLYDALTTLLVIAC